MSEKRMVYAADVIQRIRDLAPEILGGWYNPDMENELEQLVCVVENTPTAAAADAQRWRYTAEEPPKEEDGDCCGRVLIAHAGAHCAVAISTPINSSGSGPIPLPSQRTPQRTALDTVRARPRRRRKAILGRVCMFLRPPTMKTSARYAVP